LKSCKEIQELLSFYVENSLTEEEKSLVEEHLVNCSDCKMELEIYKEYFNTVEPFSAEEIIPPADFTRKVMSNIFAQRDAEPESLFTEKKTNKKKREKNRFMPIKFIGVAVAAVLLIFIVPISLLNMQGFGAKSAKNEMAMTTAPAEAPYAAMGAPDGRGGGAEEQQVFDMDSATFTNEAKMREAGVQTTSLEFERKIIKSGYINIRVNDYRQANQEIKNIIRELNGYVFNEETYSYENQKGLLSGFISLRVPAPRFEDALSLIENVGETLNRSVSAQDVTEEFLDVQGRLKALRTKEERLIDILEKAGSLSDVLAVENELARARAEIESFEGRLRYLNQRTELSTIDVNITQVSSPDSQIDPQGFAGIGARIKRAFIQSINRILNFSATIIVTIAALAPMLVVALILLLVVYFLLKRRSKNKIDKESEKDI